MKCGAFFHTDIARADRGVFDRPGADETRSEGRRRAARGWPNPATDVIDGKGAVRWKFVEADYKTRPSNEDALTQVEKADPNIK
jgi:hypothetical protein